MQWLCSAKEYMLLNQLAQTRGKVGKFFVHAVFVCRLVFRDSRKA